MWTLALLTFPALLYVCRAMPNGAPEKSCSTLLPEHRGIPGQRTNPPYMVTSVKSGDRITVTISSPSGEEFQGFVLQARSIRDPRRLVDGTFSSQNGISKTIDCFNGRQNTLTHMNINAKNRIVTEWTPAGGVNEDVTFRATVAKTYSLFWPEIESPSLRVRTGAGGSSSNQLDEDMGSEAYYRGCFESKGCHGYPSGCLNQRNCEVFLSYVDAGNSIAFTMIGALGVQAYMAMGLSTDILMGDDSVTECFLQNGRVTVRESWNNRRDNVPIREIPEGMFGSSMNDGVTTCTWNKPYLTQVNGRTFNLKNSTHYLLLAKGPMLDGRLRHHSGRIATRQEVNLTAFEFVEGEGVSESVKIHGSFMITAWVGLVSISILLARHFKSAWETRTIFGVKVWFAFHRGLMILALLFVIVAFIVIFVHKNGWDYGTSNPHAVLGCIATALGLFQPIMATFRPSPDHPKRPVFNWLHWAVGNSAHIIAVVTIFFAVTLEGSGLKESFYWVMSIFVIVHCIFHFLFQLHSWSTEKKKSNEVKMLELNSGRTPSHHTAQNNTQEKNLSGNVFRVLLLGIYGIFLAVIMMSLYALIGTA